MVFRTFAMPEIIAEIVLTPLSTDHLSMLWSDDVYMLCALCESLTILVQGPYLYCSILTYQES